MPGLSADGHCAAVDRLSASPQDTRGRMVHRGRRTDNPPNLNYGVATLCTDAHVCYCVDMTNEIWTAGTDPNRPWLANAPEKCEHCGETVWADEDSECYVNRDGNADCPAAPRVINPGGAVFGTFSGIHEAA